MAETAAHPVRPETRPWLNGASRGAWRVSSPLRGVGLWGFDLDHPSWVQGDDCLALDERQRALRLRRDEDRRRFVAGRTALREVLSLVSGRPPSQIRLGSQASGKPVLLESGVPLHFNLSHSGNLALLALSRLAPVGVDIEGLKPMPDVEALAAEHLDEDEWASWAALVPAKREEAFLRLWTRKEACLKAWGCGLNLEPQCVSVGLGPGSVRVRPPAAELGGSLMVVSLTMPENARCEAAVSLGPVGVGAGCGTRQQDH